MSEVQKNITKLTRDIRESLLPGEKIAGICFLRSEGKKSLYSVSVITANDCLEGEPEEVKKRFQKKPITGFNLKAIDFVVFYDSSNSQHNRYQLKYSTN